jgi:hypothetical protein
MNYTALLIASTLLLASCNSNPLPPQPSVPPQPTTPSPVQGQPDSNFNWVREPLALWQQQNLFDFSYWVTYDPVQLSSYSRQVYVGGDRFDTQTYSLSSGNWRQDAATTLLYSKTARTWAEQGATVTATEGPVGNAGIKTVHVTDASGTRYYSLQERDLSRLPISQGISDGFGDGRSLPSVIKNQTAQFSAGARAYTWIMDQVDPGFYINRVHYVFTNQYDLEALKTCSAITASCTSTASSISDAVAKNAWILNGGENVSVRLVGNGQAEVRYLAEGATAPTIYPVSYRHEPATSDTPERLVFGDLNASDPTVTAAVTKLLAVGNGKLAVYVYSGQAVRGVYVPAQTGMRSKSYQYNAQAIDDILTKWSPAAPPTLK